MLCALFSALSKDDVHNRVDIRDINAVYAIDIGTTTIVVGTVLTQNDVHHDVDISHINRSVSIHITLKIGLLGDDKGPVFEVNC